jgi:hypothetical protein
MPCSSTLSFDFRHYYSSEATMFRCGLLAIGLCLLATSAYPQASTAPSANAQNGHQKALLQEKLNSQFKLTKTTADRNDIVAAGSVLVLHKDGLLMCSIDTKAPPTSTYKNGKVSMGFGGTLAWGMAIGGSTDSIPQRKFVAGEKFWVTGFTVGDNSVNFQFISDPFNDVRYYGDLKFPFPKGGVPPADEMLKTVAEVVTVQADENADQNAAKPAPAPTPVTQALTPIPPPPPPADAPPPQPKTISMGQTPEVVTAILGQPQKVVNLGTKQIYYYPDMKITFVHGKVSDVQ